jgi:hypothetical protein
LERSPYDVLEIVTGEDVTVKLAGRDGEPCVEGVSSRLKFKRTADVGEELMDLM